jgi:hypothetical protein
MIVSSVQFSGARRTFCSSSRYQYHFEERMIVVGDVRDFTAIKVGGSGRLVMFLINRRFAPRFQFCGNVKHAPKHVERHFIAFSSTHLRYIGARG